MDTRICCRCKVEKPLEQFVKNKNKKHGRGHACLECHNSYRRKWDAEHPTESATVEEKICSMCETVKPASEFHRNRSSWTGLAARCKDCQANVSRGWYQQNKGRANKRMRSNALMRQYGLTEIEYDRILESQGGGCAICEAVSGNGDKRLSVDHDHQTGAVRGILCDPCNNALGFFRDDPSLLARAIQYLEN